MIRSILSSCSECWPPLRANEREQLAPCPPLVVGLRPGRLRHWYWLPSLFIAIALGVVAGLLGAVLGGLVLVWRGGSRPPRFSALVITADDLANVLWLDGQRVVLGRPYRVIYTDEMRPADCCRLRRMCLGLPE